MQFSIEFSKAIQIYKRVKLEKKYNNNLESLSQAHYYTYIFTFCTKRFYKTLSLKTIQYYFDMYDTTSCRIVE